MPGHNNLDTALVLQLGGHQVVQAAGHRVAHLDGLHQAAQAGIKLPEAQRRLWEAGTLRRMGVQKRFLQ